MKINIYQINQDLDTQRLKFMGLDAVRKVLRSAKPDCAAYDKVYSGDVKCRNLEDVFVLFQSGRPEILRILLPVLSSSAIAAENPSVAFLRISRSGIWKNTVSRNGSSAQGMALNPCNISPKIGSDESYGGAEVMPI